MDLHLKLAAPKGNRRVRYYAIFFNPLVSPRMLLLLLVVIYDILFLPLLFEFSEIGGAGKCDFLQIFTLVATAFLGTIAGLAFNMLVLIIVFKIRAWLARRRATSEALASFPKNP